MGAAVGHPQTLVSGQGGLLHGDREQKETGEMETRGQSQAKSPKHVPEATRSHRGLLSEGCREEPEQCGLPAGCGAGGGAVTPRSAVEGGKLPFPGAAIEVGVQLESWALSIPWSPSSALWP